MCSMLSLLQGLLCPLQHYIADVEAHQSWDQTRHLRCHTATTRTHFSYYLQGMVRSQGCKYHVPFLKI